jgi:hypothetical protein
MKIKEITPEQLAMLTAIIIGGSVSIVNPNYMEAAFNKTIIAIILIKLFWS